MIRTQVLKHLPGAGKGERGGSKENVRGRATARGVMKKGRYARVIEGKEVRGDDLIEYLLLTEVGSTFESHRGLWQLKSPQNEEISGWNAVCLSTFNL